MFSRYKLFALLSQQFLKPRDLGIYLGDGFVRHSVCVKQRRS